MAKKKIAISSCFMYPDPSRKVFGHKTLVYSERDMLNLFNTPKTIPLIIPDFDNNIIDEYLSECDALVLQGGSDLSPESYNEPYLDQNKWPGDKYRDDYEFRLIDQALKRNLPIFGICRGFQILNAFFGGTLHQDIPSEINTSIEHRSAEKYDKIYHEIELTGETFKKIHGNKDKIKINTVHHQCVKKLADCFQVEAICPDDQIIEAFTHKEMDKHFIFGVQWHPEFNHSLRETIEHEKPLLDYFFSSFI